MKIPKIKMSFKVIFIMLNLLIIYNLCDSENCVNIFDENIHLHLSTKTPYRFLKNTNDRKIEYENCQPIRSWSIIRHGTRNPGLNIINLMKTKLITIRDRIINNPELQLCNKQIELFREWHSMIDENEAKYLVLEGTDELLKLGERFHLRFPGFLSETYNSRLYKFKFTDTQRTRSSFKAFVSGLFGRENLHSILYEEPLKRDPILRFYKLCKKWKKEVDKNPDTLSEMKLWGNSNEMKKALKSIELNFGLTNITVDDVRLMYTTCTFELASNKYSQSPWCLLFNSHSIKVMEFFEDLEYYWIDGYGYNLTYAQACPAISDMFKHITPNSKEPNATFYFTHSGTILKLLAHLGLYKDEFQLTHNDFDKERKWESSKIDVFASNLMFITYNCENGIYVLTMHQENVINIPGCPENTDLCDINTFSDILKESINNCNFNEMCTII